MWITLVKLGLIAALIAAGVAVSWAVVDTGIHKTSDDEFCTGCHSHEPIGTSYRASLHGGNNEQGWRASCSQCHISHDSSLHYLWVKGIHGVVDPVMELLKDSFDIDWHGRRADRERYVYDSGCLSCHKTLEKRSMPNPKAFLPHRDYFSDPQKHQCVSCHKHVGHDVLGIHLEEMGWERKQ